jgi:ribosomal protein S14
MATIHKARYCRRCGHKTLHLRERFSNTAGCLLTVITAGLFIPIWALLMIGNLGQRWQCAACGRKRSF